MKKLDYTKMLEEFGYISDPKEKAAFEARLKATISGQSAEEAMQNIQAIDSRVSAIEDIIDLGEVADMASMAYVAKKYFNKSRAWLYQRLNGNVVHGKPAQLTQEERVILARAFDDMSNKLKEKSLSILNG